MAYRKASLPVHHLAILPGELHDFGMAWPLVHITQELGEGLIVALRLPLDLWGLRQHERWAVQVGATMEVGKKGDLPTLLSGVFLHHPVMPYSWALPLVKYLIL